MYSGMCTPCKDTNVVAQYFGETGDSGYCRMRQHKTDIRTECETNGFAKHLEIHHPDKKKDHTVFEMKVEKNFKKNLDRQCFEGTLIANNQCDILMNSRSEFHGPAVPRVTVTREHQANRTRNVGQ